MTEQEAGPTRDRSKEKLERLKAIVGSFRSAVVAYSGGVDSAFLLEVTRRVLGPGCTAVLAVSPSLAERERREAIELAGRLGVRLEVEPSHELEDPRYAANPPDRCYYCKADLFALCERKRVEVGAEVVFDGFNAEDRSDWRPGHRAANERGVRSPLAEAGLTKAEVRAWSLEMGLPTWDKPQMACLASRLPYGTTVTAERLVQVGGAEQDLWDLGLRQFRVRHHGDLARVEVAAEEYGKLWDEPVRRAAAEALRRRGYKFVALDLEPFRSGRMNEAAGIGPAADPAALPPKP